MSHFYNFLFRSAHIRPSATRRARRACATSSPP